MNTKDIKNESGIYEIINIKNNKRYIGQSIHVRTRVLKHRRLLRKNEHLCKHLQNSWNKYGEENFYFNVIEYCDVEDLDRKEDFYINKYKTNSNLFGYNQRIDNKTNRGLKWSEEQREKMKIAIENNPWYKNHTIPLEVMEKAWEAARNRVWTEEERKRHSEILTGTKVADTTKMKLAQRGENNPSDKLTEEEVKEIILLLKNKYCGQQLLGKVYHVAQTNISAIATNRSWKHISRDAIDNSYYIRGIERVEEYKKNM